MTRVIGIMSGKGGVGKTTVAANLAVCLVQLGKEVIIVDCNISTSHLALYFGMYDYSVTINDVLKGKYEIYDAIYEHKSGVKIIPASLSSHSMIGVDIVNLRKKIKEILGMADFVLLDSAPGFGRETMGTLLASSEVLLVANPNFMSIVDIMRVKDVLREYNVKLTGLVVNMYKKKYRMKIEEIEEMCDVPVLVTIPFDEEIARSLFFKIPVVILKPNASSSKKFRELARKLCGIEEERSTIERIARFLLRLE
jgi:cell division ATPase MinD